MSWDNVLPMLVRGAYYLGLGAWVGSMLMIVAGAPVPFRTLPSRSQAGDVVGGWLKAYYRMGLACAAVAAAATLFRATQWEGGLWKGSWGIEKAVGAVRLSLLALMILNHLYAGWSVDPEVHALKAAGDPARPAFEALHRRSVRLLGANLVSGIAVIFLS